MVKPPTDSTSDPRNRRVLSGRRLLVGLSLVAVTLFVIVNRRDFGAFASALRSASPTWLVLSALMALSGVGLGYSGVHRVAITESGVPIPVGTGVRLGLRAFALNTLVKSGGLAGMVPYLRNAERDGASRLRTRTGYLLANILGDVAVAVALVITLRLLALQHRLSRTVVATSAMFGVYLLSIAAAVVAAARSRESVRRLHALPTRLLDALRRRPPAPVDHHAADEMHAAIGQLRSRPFALAPALGWALLVDVTGVITLLLVLRAFGQPARLSLALSGMQFRCSSHW